MARLAWQPTQRPRLLCTDRAMSCFTVYFWQVGDFGLATHMDDERQETHISALTAQGTLSHMAPELLLHGHISKHCDTVRAWLRRGAEDCRAWSDRVLWLLLSSSPEYIELPCLCNGCAGFFARAVRVRHPAV